MKEHLTPNRESHSQQLLLCRLSGASQPRQTEAAWTSVKWALQRAEIAGCHPSATQYIRDAVTIKMQDGPEAIAYAAVRACIDSEAALIITISQTGADELVTCWCPDLSLPTVLVVFMILHCWPAGSSEVVAGHLNAHVTHAMQQDLPM